MTDARLITAIGTPLTEDEQLHEDGLIAELTDQWASQIDGVLVAGTMGYFQMLTDSTYHRLVERAVELVTGQGEILIGAGDTSFYRTRDRIQIINRYKVDGVAVVTPFFVKFAQDELIAYFRGLAEASKAPLYLYDLPGLTGVKLEVPTVLELAKHPNIAGIKSSDRFDLTRHLLDAVAEHAPDFRVIVAQPDLLDVAVRQGVREHLDGMYAIAPHWAAKIVRFTEAGDHETATRFQHDLSALRRTVNTPSGAAMFTALMNARGIPGLFSPRPFRRLTDQQHQSLLQEPVVQRLLAVSQ